jgi:hypothetical protein
MTNLTCRHETRPGGQCPAGPQRAIMTAQNANVETVRFAIEDARRYRKASTVASISIGGSMAGPLMRGGHTP